MIQGWVRKHLSRGEGLAIGISEKRSRGDEGRCGIGMSSSRLTIST